MRHRLREAGRIDQDVGAADRRRQPRQRRAVLDRAGMEAVARSFQASAMPRAFRASRLATTAIAAPDRASSRAEAAPMPLEPPSTTA
jgi:hypothetical protein